MGKQVGANINLRTLKTAYKIKYLNKTSEAVILMITADDKQTASMLACRAG